MITTSSFGRADKLPLDTLSERGIKPVLNPYGRTLTADEVTQLLHEIDPEGMIAGTEPLGRDELRGQSRLKVISRVGVGLNNIDLNAARELGIEVYNTPDGPTRPVAELTIALMLDVLRGVSRADAVLRSGGWEKRMGRLLHDKTVGVIGFGRIGTMVSSLVQAFGGIVIAYDVCPDYERAAASDVVMVDLDELLSQADIITLHVAGGNGEGFLIADREISIMKPGAILINTARGNLVDEKALVNALMCNKLGGAALDTFSTEPYAGSLTELPNVVLSPHVGSYAAEARVAMELQAVENVIAGLAATEGARAK